MDRVYLRDVGNGLEETDADDPCGFPYVPENSTEVPYGIRIKEGVTMDNGVVTTHKFGEPLSSNPEEAFGPEVIEVGRVAELIECLGEAIEAIDHFNCIRIDAPGYAKRHREAIIKHVPRSSRWRKVYDEITGNE